MGVPFILRTFLPNLGFCAIKSSRKVESTAKVFVMQCSEQVVTVRMSRQLMEKGVIVKSDLLLFGAI